MKSSVCLMICMLIHYVKDVHGDQCFSQSDEDILSNTRKLVKSLERKKERCVSCPDEWESYLGHCYYFGNSRKTWWEAKDDCKRRKAYLIKIDDAAENQWVKTKLKDKPADSSWIGASDENREGEWKWENDNSSLTFSDWYRNQPDDGSGSEDCAHFYRSFSYHWNDDQCYNFAAYICEANK